VPIAGQAGIRSRKGSHEASIYRDVDHFWLQLCRTRDGLSLHLWRCGKQAGRISRQKNSWGKVGTSCKSSLPDFDHKDFFCGARGVTNYRHGDGAGMGLLVDAAVEMHFAFPMIEIWIGKGDGSNNTSQQPHGHAAKTCRMRPGQPATTSAVVGALVGDIETPTRH
jgi:hypothetical protein